MAFVNPIATSFFGNAPKQSLSTCRVQPSTTPCTLQSAPRMAFTSIDQPENAVVLRDYTNVSKEDIIRGAYKHVFGNAYLMEEEREELAKIESDFKLGDVDVSELIRAMGKSHSYRKRFFERSGPYRFVELNCKHFLGRGPISQEEISFHVQKVVNEGYDAEIDSYIDSDEYEEKFGRDIVPRFMFLGTYNRQDNFGRMLIMRKYWDGCSTSTVSGSTAPGKPIPAQLIMGHGGYVNGHVGIMKGLPAGFRPEASIAESGPPIPKNSNAPLRVRIKVAENAYQVFEVPAQLPKDDPQWKKELVGAKRWNGVWY